MPYVINRFTVVGNITEYCFYYNGRYKRYESEVEARQTAVSNKYASLSGFGAGFPVF